MVAVARNDHREAVAKNRLAPVCARPDHPPSLSGLSTSSTTFPAVNDGRST
jgi:hypothetical protein